MMIKTKIYLSAMIMGFVFQANAANLTDELCGNLAGHWQGTFTIKDPSICTLYKGCTHGVRADTIYLEGPIYQVTLVPEAGQGGVFNIACENGVITSPVNPNNTINATCDSSGHCTLAYEDPLLSCQLTK